MNEDDRSRYFNLEISKKISHTLLLNQLLEIGERSAKATGSPDEYFLDKLFSVVGYYSENSYRNLSEISKWTFPAAVTTTMDLYRQSLGFGVNSPQSLWLDQAAAIVDGKKGFYRLNDTTRSHIKPRPDVPLIYDVISLTREHLQEVGHLPESRELLMNHLCAILAILSDNPVGHSQQLGVYAPEFIARVQHVFGDKVSNYSISKR
jgi:hypothetical protein